MLTSNVNMCHMQFTSSSSSRTRLVTQKKQFYLSTSVSLSVYHSPLQPFLSVSNPYLKPRNWMLQAFVAGFCFKHLICVTETIAYPRLLEHSKHRRGLCECVFAWWKLCEIRKWLCRANATVGGGRGGSVITNYSQTQTFQNCFFREITVIFHLIIWCTLSGIWRRTSQNETMLVYHASVDSTESERLTLLVNLL